MKIQILPEQKQHYNTISMINDMAFGQEAEGQLVVKLRKNRNFKKELSLVACMGPEVVGHILFFPIEIEMESGKHPTLALAPISVIPELQGLGIGSQMIEKGLAKAKKLGYDSVIVLGHESYYPRFGFQPASNWKITAPFDAPDAAFMAIELTKGALENTAGCVQYPKEFDEV